MVYIGIILLKDFKKISLKIQSSHLKHHPISPKILAGLLSVEKGKEADNHISAGIDEE